VRAPCQGAKTTQLASEARSEPLSANERSAQLLERVSARVYRYFLRNVWDPGEAEELAQRTFFELTRSLRTGRYDPTRSFNAWLWIKAHSVFVDWCRQRPRKAKPLSSAAHKGIASGDEAVENKLDAETILAAIRDRLGAETLETFVLYHESDLSLEEIALAVGRDRKTVTKMLREAERVANTFAREQQ
jgi:RNA polymerase sigma factor (sigma-70 family)